MKYQPEKPKIELSPPVCGSGIPNKPRCPEIFASDATWKSYQLDCIEYAIQQQTEILKQILIELEKNNEK